MSSSEIACDHREASPTWASTSNTSAAERSIVIAILAAAIARA
jgi:hypothetical protein